MSKVDYAIEHLGLAIEAAASLNVPTIVIPTDVAITLHTHAEACAYLFGTLQRAFPSWEFPAIALRVAAQPHSKRHCQCTLAPIRESQPNVCLRCGLDIKDDAAQSHSTPNTHPPA